VIRKRSSTKMSQPMSVITSSESNEWYTPSDLVERIRKTLGVISLDPASHPVPQAWIRAEHYFTKADDGLSRPWHGHVFLNPPYGRSASKWAAKLIKEYESKRVKQAILLIGAKQGYVWFEKIWRAYPVCSLEKRVRFVNQEGEQNGQAKLATTLVYFGQDVERFRETFSDIGRVILAES
jgi:DNA N-6-adenine-methyltransferase (Dam)